MFDELKRFDGQIDKIISEYGDDMQMDVAIEEMSELTKEIVKYRRYHGRSVTVIPLRNIESELADVLLMMYQLIKIFEISEEDLAKIIEYKIYRTIRRMQDD